MLNWNHQQCQLAPRAWLQGISAIFRNGIISSWQCSNHLQEHLLYVTFPYMSMQKPNENLQYAATDSKGPAAVSRILCPEHPAARNFCPNKRSYQRKSRIMNDHEWSTYIHIQLVGSSMQSPKSPRKPHIVSVRLGPMIWILEENHILNFYNCHDCNTGYEKLLQQSIHHPSWEGE